MGMGLCFVVLLLVAARHNIRMTLLLEGHGVSGEVLLSGDRTDQVCKPIQLSLLCEIIQRCSQFSILSLDIIYGTHA